MVCVQLTGAETHDSQVAFEMTALLNVREIEQFVADKGYDDDDLRDWLDSQKIQPVIPSRDNRNFKRFCDETVYTWRRRIENLFGKMKENRRLALRVDKLDTSFMGFVALSLIKLHVC